jgi:outer membrane protein assembly factor BamB
MRSYDPQSGELLWEMKGSGRTATTPVGDAELLYVDSYDRLTGTSGVLIAIRPGGSGDITLSAKETTNEHVAWSVPISGGRIASPLLYQGCLSFDNAAAWSVVSSPPPATHTQRVSGASGFVSSPWANDGHVYCLDQDGRTSVLEAGPELKVAASNELSEMCWGAAGIAGDRILIRTIDHLYSIGP